MSNLKEILAQLGENKEEIIRKAAGCKNSDELAALGQKYDIKLDAAEAQKLLAAVQFKTGVLSDDELDTVAGGMDTEASKDPDEYKIKL